MWYTEGTVAVTSGGTNITGTGTSFLTNARVGDGITITGSTALHEIIGVTSNTQLSIRPAYAGTTGSGRTYGISPLLGYDKDLSDAFNQLRLQFGDQLSNLQTWATASTALEARNELGASPSGDAVFTGTPTQGREALGISGAAVVGGGVWTVQTIDELEDLDALEGDQASVADVGLFQLTEGGWAQQDGGSQLVEGTTGGDRTIKDSLELSLPSVDPALLEALALGNSRGFPRLPVEDVMRYDRLLRKLRHLGVLDRLAFLYVLAAPTREWAYVNLLDPANYYLREISGQVAFEPHMGTRGIEGSEAYLLSDVNAAESDNYLENDVSYGAWFSRISYIATSSAAASVSTSHYYAHITPLLSNGWWGWRINTSLSAGSTANASQPRSDGTGLIVLNRRPEDVDPDDYSYNRYGRETAVYQRPTSSVPSAEFRINRGGGTRGPTTNTVAVHFAGLSLTPTQISKMESALHEFLSSGGGGITGVRCQGRGWEASSRFFPEDFGRVLEIEEPNQRAFYVGQELDDVADGDSVEVILTGQGQIQILPDPSVESPSITIRNIKGLEFTNRYSRATLTKQGYRIFLLSGELKETTYDV